MSVGQGFSLAKRVRGFQGSRGLLARANFMERSALVEVHRKGQDRSPDSGRELERLAESAGAIVVERLEQQLENFHPAFLVGRGKLEEIREKVRELDLVIFNRDLSPVQYRNLEDFLGVKVVDRTGLILDIFAQRARTREGKIQVEAAQLAYLLPRLSGKGKTLSRLGGGIGTRGPGETKLEVDRQRVRKRIAHLERELEKITRHREVQRRGRVSRALPTFALVGYTNTGKSTLLNRLGKAQVETADRLFCTLDPTIRRVWLADGLGAAVIDTVGLIQGIPHSLVAAFRATFEEVREALGLIVVFDASNPRAGVQAETVFRVMEEVEIGRKATIMVLNKCDLVENPLELSRLSQGFDPPVVCLSALTGEGMEDLKAEMRKIVESARVGE